METDVQDIMIRRCLTQIEEALGWGNGSDWSTRDFEALGQRIMEKTQVQLSVITLKRIWGRIRYDHRPTATTLNTLAQFLGFENWGAYKQDQLRENDTAALSGPKGNKAWKRVVFVPLFVLFLVLMGFLLNSSASSPEDSRTIDPAQVEFSSKKTVDTGVPNSVVFFYNASAAKSGDSVFVQQSWDKTLSRQVDSRGSYHTSIYYYPGFYRAKLRINDQVVKEHDLLIGSDGWLPLIDRKPVPFYLESIEVKNDGYMGLPLAKFQDLNIPLQPETPWTGYYNVGLFDEVYSHDLIFETALKNEYAAGTAVCQHSEIHLLFEGASMVIPLSVPGCISELNLGSIDGKKADLSVLGVDFSDWVSVKFEVLESAVKISINQDKVINLRAAVEPVRLVGLAYRFQGTGSVNFIRITRHNGDVVYEENFD